MAVATESGGATAAAETGTVTGAAMATGTEAEIGAATAIGAGITITATGTMTGGVRPQASALAWFWEPRRGTTTTPFTARRRE
jgi:hypothetical protein